MKYLNEMQEFYWAFSKLFDLISFTEDVCKKCRCLLGILLLFSTIHSSAKK